MNYLAHALLAGPERGLLLGGLMGDFVKGPLTEGDWPGGVHAGLRLHRRIDSFTDSHPLAQRSRARIGPRRRRFAGIIVDLCYDHFLAREWERFGRWALHEFTTHVYASLQQAGAQLPERLARIAPRMAAQDWLGSYARVEGLAAALDGIARRRASVAPLAGAIEDVLADYAGFRDDFRTFFPEAQRYAAAERRALAPNPIS